MSVSIPASWMPDANMRRIHVHWTAGRHKANATDLKSYHVLIEGDGTPRRGGCPISANDPARRKPGEPRANHTLNANSHSIGISLCCMFGAQERPFDAGAEPLTEAQWQSMIETVAILCKRYGIPVTPETVLTHAEVQPNLSIAQRNKWDITVLPFDRGTLGAQAVGDKMRREVAAALDTARPPLGQPPDSMKAPRFRVSGVAPSTLNFRRGPDGEIVGALPEGTRVERLGISDGWWQVRTPAGHIGWVWHSFLRAIN
ncbi:N-acetylmuramoyl-L-alanine amidase [Pararhodobacter sp. SW119]|uniref:N-acetylmuramoyl-L-alanine amidase n=1 Tax=Pararhodobacter sp. SW119 TaxID=2780075 RepID=UPI001AE08484|nr:N-acetylmuramoyl-L-alanine amidase [Pararhodobacter sp. SW119]